MNNKVIVLTGTTASGKTALSVELAKAFGGEIVNADSMQVYRLMNIGTAKPTENERCGIPHHMMDIVMPDENFTLSRYLEGARAAVEDILHRGRLPVVVGGTGLYISSLVNNVCLCPAETDYEYRAYLKTLDGKALKKLLTEVDPDRAGELHENDVKRLARALELYSQTKMTAKQQREQSLKNKSPYEFLSFCLTCRSRQTLYDRIDARVDDMLSRGLEAEVKSLYDSGYLENNTAAQAIGYKEFVPYFKNQNSLNEVIDKIKQESRRYAKRQLTWFRRAEFLKWLYIDDDDNKSSEFLLDFLLKQVEIFINV